MANNVLTTEVEKLKENLRQTRKAILGRGGTIGATAGMKDLPSAIFDIPVDVSLAYSTDDTTAYQKTVPNGVEDYAQLKSVGGMTRIETGVNLLKVGENGIGDTPYIYQEEQTIYWSYDALPYGHYRFYCKIVPEIDDDVVTAGAWLYVSDVDSGEYTKSFLENGALFWLSGNEAVSVKCGAGALGAEPDIKVTQYGGSNDGEIALGETHQLQIGGGSYCDISIKTNTRVKVTVSDQFETYNGTEEFVTEKTEFIVTKGNYVYEWRNISDSYASYTIKVEQYIPDSINVTVYPMVYSVPDDSPEWIRTEYVPYYEALVPTAVTEIVSKGKNLFDKDNVIRGSFTSTGEFLSMPHVLRTEKPISVISGKTYTISCDPTYDLRYLYFYNSNMAYLSTIMMGRPQNHYYKFTVPSKAAFLHISFEIDGATSGTTADLSAAKANSKVQLEVGSVATEYKPYWSETVAIPDAVKNDASWGCGVGQYANTYDFNAKEYTKWIDKTIVLDGNNYKSVNVGTDSTSGNRYIDILIGDVTYKNYKAVKFTGFTTEMNYNYGTGYIYGASDGLRARLFVSSGIDTKEKADVWLKDNPVEMQYVLLDPFVTTIYDAVANFIKVEGGGELVFENDAKADVPSSIKYVKKV